MKRPLTIISIFILLFTGCKYNNKEIRVIADKIYGYKNGMALTMDVFIPQNQNGAAVIFINSGGFRSPDFSRQCISTSKGLWSTGNNKMKFREKDSIQPELIQSMSFEEILNNGYVVFDIRHGSSPKYMLDEIIEDLHKAISFIKNQSQNYGFSKDRIGIYGGSAGGYLATYLVANPKKGNDLKAAVIFYPAGYDFLDDRNKILRKDLPSLSLPDKILDSLSLKNYLKHQLPPTLLMYGNLDYPFITGACEDISNDLVQSKTIFKKIVYKDVGHVWRNKNQNYNSKIGDKAMNELIEWFKKNL